ncbi:MAG: hypothetical protein ACFBRM_02885 [Pikeienuella sp.]
MTVCPRRADLGRARFGGWFALALILVSLTVASGAGAGAGSLLERQRILEAERAAEALSRRYGAGPTAARRSVLSGDLHRLQSDARRQRLGPSDLGRRRARLNSLTGQIRRTGALDAMGARMGNGLGTGFRQGGVGGRRGSRLLGIGIPRTSLGLDALRVSPGRP